VEGKAAATDRVQLPAGADLDRQALDSRVPAADPIVVPHCRHDAGVDVGHPVGQCRSGRRHRRGGQQLPWLKWFDRQAAGTSPAAGRSAGVKRGSKPFHGGIPAGSRHSCDRSAYRAIRLGDAAEEMNRSGTFPPPSKSLASLPLCGGGQRPACGPAAGIPSRCCCLTGWPGTA